MRPITLILPYYENPQMLQLQYGFMRAYPADIRNWLRVIVVDDGSPDNPAIPGLIGAPLSLYRMLVDIRWNQDSCRNLGVSKAKTEWVLLTDIDHLVPEQTLRRCMTDDLVDVAYRFERETLIDFETRRTEPYHPHPNSWLLTKSLYDKMGGYDESFAGIYGTDGDFAKRLLAYGIRMLMGAALVRVPREVVPDASTTRYTRKQDSDYLAKARVLRNRRAGAKIVRNRFPWEVVYEC